MPSLEMFRKLNSSTTNGAARKSQSDAITNASWWEDIGAKQAYIYDYYHDDEKLKYKDLHPENSETKTPVDIKFVINAYNSEAKDVVGKHIQFRPGHTCELSYYETSFAKKYEAEYPMGLYVDIQDESGIYRKWMVTELANTLDLQFPTWYILPCDHIFQWVHDGIKYQMCGVSRAQSSYTSGEWTDYKITSTDNQRKCILPMNDISTTIFYNQRIVLSAPIPQPVVWHVSKVEQTAPKGVNRITFVQEEWDEHKDVFEYQYYDEESSSYKTRISNTLDYDINKESLIGMWASYWDTNIAPEDSSEEEKTDVYSSITYSGTSPELKIGGGYKKLTVDFYDGEEKIEPQAGEWSYSIEGNDASSLIETSTEGLESNQIKIKFTGDKSYIGKILIATYTSTESSVTSSLNLELKRL